MHKVIFTANTFSDKKIESLKEQGIEIIKQPHNLSESELVNVLQDVEGYILGGDEIATRTVIESANKLKIIAFLGAGYERYIDVAAAKEKGVIVTNTPGANSQAVAEFTVSLLLDSVKKTSYLNQVAKNGGWEKKQVWNLQGKTVGIIGMGNIGSKVAYILNKGFGMNVLYVSRSSKPEIEQSLGVQKTTLNELLANSDVVSIHASQSNETVGMIGEKELALMKKSAVLINPSRAEIVDGKALYEALQNGKLAAAAFDAYYVEPLPEPENDEYKLMGLANDRFILTTHNAYNSSDAVEAMEKMIEESLTSVFSGEKPKYSI
ncbi:hydroxyacid dehydrogenase [Candidatus Roizmanbacteria bacterium]|nr:hydroxyacid dehydrogenase [Candidatus Roizmanbacteria bacterium]